jgi:hypothetical protein
MRINQRKKTIDELLTFEVADLAKSHLTTKVIVAVSVTTWTSKGTFAGDLDRQCRNVTAKDSPPRGDNAFHHPTITKDFGGCGISPFINAADAAKISRALAASPALIS